MTERERLIDLLAKFMVECRRPCHKLHSNKTCQECGTGQLTDYLLANGVIVPPCKVGEKVYYLLGSEICDATVIRLEANYYTEPQLWLTIEFNSQYVGKHETKSRVDLMLGKTVFLTKEEAEQALKGGAE